MYEDWYRASVNLNLEGWDSDDPKVQQYLEESRPRPAPAASTWWSRTRSSSTATCGAAGFRRTGVIAYAVVDSRDELGHPFGDVLDLHLDRRAAERELRDIVGGEPSGQPPCAVEIELKAGTD